MGLRVLHACRRVPNMRAADAPAQINVRLASRDDLDKLEKETREGGFLSIAEMIRSKHGLTPWPNDTSPKRTTIKKVAARASMR